MAITDTETRHDPGFHTDDTLATLLALHVAQHAMLADALFRQCAGGKGSGKS